jgi:hypothetical protein
MLANDLVTNEIKNAAQTEEEFTHILLEGRSRTFARKNEQYAYPHRLTISHQENGVGLDKRRRGVVRFDKTVAGQIDATRPMKGSAYIVTDIPVGNMSSNALAADLIANLLSFCATTGAATTVLFDGTGNGATALLTGGL